MKVQLIECPRDAMQGWPAIIPTAVKVNYINSLLKCGFDTVDFGSFVSAKAIPQMADTPDVIEKLEFSGTKTKLLAIVANLRGAEQAAHWQHIHFLGFPFSISPTFQFRNTNSSMEESIERVATIQDACMKTGKQLVVYLSMAFGNPYGDRYNEAEVVDWALKMHSMGIEIISLADTVGVATAEQVGRITEAVVKALPGTTVGVHLHSTAENWREKLEAAYTAGCRRFDGALKGIGGCPMAGNALVGNMDTEKMYSFFKEMKVETGIDERELSHCSRIAAGLFV
ncbi:hydroxymethylglutaryl-CoA lyase [Pollutibacter soli]|uniref:hydroxymethylglutaryl-CoA lyase n=1 Tax=Pollutibacter soli TaxID=3034157 RepID=UPI0030132684